MPQFILRELGNFSSLLYFSRKETAAFSCNRYAQAIILKALYSIAFLALLSMSASSQCEQSFLYEFIIDFNSKLDNETDAYNKYDFSSLWLNTPNHVIVGVIGDDYERIKVKLLTIKKDDYNPNLYHVTGKSLVKENRCNFSGQITLRQISNSGWLNGVDNMYADSGIKAQALIIADYKFVEDSTQRFSGMFSGKLYSKWYLDSNESVRYNDIDSYSDGYMNNAFLGTWTSYTTKAIKKCNWADHRVPCSNSRFDIGAAEFSPSEEYFDKGWESYSKAWAYGDKKAKDKERAEWWK